jgi:hypothetical protein
MRQRGIASKGLCILVSVPIMSLPQAVRTVSLCLCLDALLAQHLQLLGRHPVDQPILLGHRLGCNGLEQARHVEGRRTKPRTVATLPSLSTTELVGLSLSLLRGAAPPGMHFGSLRQGTFPIHMFRRPS